MSEPLYDLFFAGEIMAGQDPERVRAAVARMFGADDDTLARLFSGRPVKIKSAVDQETAIRYRVAFRDAGALVEVRPLAPDAPRAAPAPATGGTGETPMQLLPPRTGDLSDCVPTREAAPLPDISAITLAAEGSIIDASEPPPPARIDTGDLTLAPAASGTLEDCQRPPQPHPLPDISNLQLSDDD